MNVEQNDRLFAAIEKRRSRPVTAAERNIDIHGLQTEMEDGKARLVLAIEKGQRSAIRRWIRNAYIGEIQVLTTPSMLKILRELYEAGERHGNAELARAGYHGFAHPDRKALRMLELLHLLRSKLVTVTARLARRSTELDVGELTQYEIARALSKVPGALDVASRMVSTATYRGLGAAFDQAAGVVDQSPVGTGGNGWEYTAIMDGGTCTECARRDGETYATWEEGTRALPDGGPNPFCFGDGRCRCRLAPAPL